MNTYAADYVPIVETAVYLTKSNITCSLDKNNDGNRIDFCDAQASMDIRVTIAQMRSIQASTSEGFTPDAKIVRFTIQEGKTGTGFHLADELKQGNGWYESNANRTTYIGPFAKSYDLWVKPTGGYIPKKVSDFPHNENKNYQHRDTHGITIGVNGSVGAEASAAGPKVSAEVGASFAYNNSKTLVFDTKDYRVNNKSSLSDFEVSFEREITACEGLIRQDIGCSFNEAHWANGPVFDKTKYNPISYANFKPNYDVSFEVPVSERGITEFELGAKITYAMHQGSVRPVPLYSVYSAELVRSFGSAIQERLLINWNHPLFEGEAHVRLQSLSANNLCLEAFSSSENGSVYASSCNDSWQQTWGLDSEERYRSRVYHDRCLTVNSDKTLSTNRCGLSLTQKWVWQGDKLMSRYVDDTSNRYFLNISDNNTPLISPESESNKALWKPLLKQVKL